MMLSVVYMVGRPVPLYFERFRMIASMISVTEELASSMLTLTTVV